MRTHFIQKKTGFQLKYNSKFAIKSQRRVFHLKSMKNFCNSFWKRTEVHSPMLPLRPYFLKITSSLDVLNGIALNIEHKRTTLQLSPAVKSRSTSSIVGRCLWFSSRHRLAIDKRPWGQAICRPLRGFWKATEAFWSACREFAMKGWSSFFFLLKNLKMKNQN